MSESNGNGNGTFHPTYYLRAYELARSGQEDGEIAGGLGVRLHVLRRWMRNDDAFEECITRGRSEQDGDVRRDISGQLRNTQLRFLAAYAESGNISAASRTTGISRESHYRWLEEDDYPLAFQYANDIAVDALEEEARRRAHKGLQRQKFHQGMPIMTECEPNDPQGHEVEWRGEMTWVKPYIEHEYSDTLLIFLLKAKRPDVFRDKPIEVNQNQTNIGVDMNQLLQLAERQNVIEGDFVAIEAQRAIEAHNG